VDDAIVAFRRALDSDPAYAQAARNLGNALREVGDLDEAVRWLRRAVELDPRDTVAHRYLVESQPADAAQRAQLDALTRDCALDDAARIDLFFALATAYASERPELAFQHLLHANRLKRSTIAYDESPERTLLGSLCATFSPTLVRAMRGCGNPSTLPVFVIGMPRAGSTLVEQILAAHRDVHAAGELELFERAFGLFPPMLSDPRDARAFAAELRDALANLGTRYLEQLPAVQASRITDKMPSNFRFAVPIHLALPNAKLVHVRRNPLDTCLSCFATHFVDGQLYTYDLRELGRYYRLYEKHMQYVRALVPSGTLLEIEYEALVADFEVQARRIVAHCGLDWDYACLEFWRVDRPVRTASAVQVRRPLYSESVGRWRRYERELAPLIEALAE